MPCYCLSRMRELGHALGGQCNRPGPRRGPRRATRAHCRLAASMRRRTWRRSALDAGLSPPCPKNLSAAFSPSSPR
eukprot:8071676-Pyramimonas_sp.AAC.1